MKAITKDRPIIIEDCYDLNSEKNLPELWRVAQDLIASNEKDRLQAIKDLEELDVIKYSPLMVYLISTRLEDSNAKVRYHATELILSILRPDENGHRSSMEVREELFSTLSKISKETLLGILQTSIDNSGLRSKISKLINYCPQAGNHLASILVDRKYPIEIRRQAVDLIGLIGYVENKSTLLRIKTRIESRSSHTNGIQNISGSLGNEKILLQSINTALTLLQNP